MISFVKPASIALALGLLLAGCDSPEERAEEHFSQGMALLQEGKLEQAGIEFRNALQQNNAHASARLELARLLETTGNSRGAIGQYLALIEQDEAHGPANLALARLAIEQGDYQAAETHAQRAYELLPEEPMARALMASVEFRAGNTEAAVALAEEALADSPDNVPAHLVLVSDRMAAEDFAGALEKLDAALAVAPDSTDLHLARLTSLEGEGDLEAVGRQLQDMVERFPENEGFRDALLQWYLDQNDVESAVALMRDVAGRTPEDPTGYLNVAQLLLQTSGTDAARQELQRLIDEREDRAPFIRALSELDFALGNREEAIAALRSLTKTAEPSPETRDLQIALANLLLQTGAEDEAHALVDAVLAEDERHVGALKIRARRLIDEDRVEEALRDMATAAQEAPNDPEILTIMAEAHEREGARDLAGQRLARAVEASSFGKEESIRYARFLAGDERFGEAENLLLDVLRRNPNDPDLLGLLGRVHVQQGDLVQARQVAETLKTLEGPAAAEMARSLELSVLRAQGSPEDLVRFYEEVAAGAEGDIRPRLALVETHLAAGDLAKAEEEIGAILAEWPDSQAARLVQAEVLIRKGETEEAESIYRDLISEIPEIRLPYEGLFALLNGTGRVEEAQAVLDQGIEATNRNPNLLNIKAQLSAMQGDTEEAIALFEELYARDPSNVVVANNLASLLSAHRENAESLDRAFAVARRLRGAENPFYQDTYGWILTRRGDPAQALTYLEPAAAALSQDPLTQYHLGITYFDLERWEDARKALSRAVDIAGEGSELPQIDDARRRITELDDREEDARAKGGSQQSEP